MSLELQQEMERWVRETMGDVVYESRRERITRFFEEACELAQAMEMPYELALHMVGRCYARRPPGAPREEIAGVGLTLFTLAQVMGVDVMETLRMEMRRIWSKQAEIRLKHAAKVREGIALQGGLSQAFVDRVTSEPHIPGEDLPVGSARADRRSVLSAGRRWNDKP